MKRLALFFLIGILYTITLVFSTSCSYETSCATYSKGNGKTYNARAASMQRKMYFYRAEASSYKRKK